MYARILVCCLALSLVNSLPVSICSAIQVNWDGADGDEDDPRTGDGIHWHDGFNWDTDFVPGMSDDADVGMAHPLILETELFLVSDIEVGLDGGIDIRGTLNSSGDTIENNGEIFIDNGPMPGPAGLGVAVGTLEGTGEVILGDSDFANSGARLLGPSVGGSTTHAAGHTIRGEGTISGNWINDGLILPEDISGDSTGTLRIQGSMTNNGTLQTSDTASLLFSVNITQGSSGRIIADENKVIFSAVGITGGTLESINGGIIEGNFGTSHLNQVHNQAQINMTGDFGSSLRIEGGGITNDGTIVIASEPTNTSSFFFGSGISELTGSGELILNREGLNARIQATDATTVGINGANHTIRGVGSIDATLINEGTIIAEPRVGTVLEFHDANSDSMTTNNNVIRADAGGVLRLRNVLLSQNESTGRIIANEGTVELQSGQLGQPLIDGGRLETVGAGTIEVIANTRIDEVTNEGTLNIQPAKELRIGSGFTNNGTVSFQSINGPSFSAASLIFIDSATLDGDGEFVLSETSGVAFHSVRVETGFTATQGSEHTIRGEGLINCCGSLGKFINNGRIEGTSITDDIEINGTLGGSGVLKNVAIRGNHSPGESTASVPLEGAYTVKDFGGTLSIEVGGTTAGSEYDQLFSTDPNNLVTIGTTQTTLNVSFVDLGNSYVPAVGDRFTIMSSPNNIVGEFDTINLSTFGLGHNITWLAVDRSDPTKYVLEIAAVSDFFFDADFDEDGDVDGDDLTVWQSGYGTGTLHNEGNADGDLDVDGRDFLIWQRQLGSGVEPLVDIAAVPEPSVIPLVLALALPLWRGIADRK